MKKILIIGLVCILIGGAFCGTAYAVGERSLEQRRPKWCWEKAQQKDRLSAVEKNMRGDTS